MAAISEVILGREKRRSREKLADISLLCHDDGQSTLSYLPYLLNGLQ